MDWKDLYPEFLAREAVTENASCDRNQVKFLDVGCGYGGLLGKKLLFLMDINLQIIEILSPRLHNTRLGNNYRLITACLFLRVNF